MDSVTAKAIKTVTDQLLQLTRAHNTLANALREATDQIEQLEAEVGFLRCRLDNPDVP